MDRVTAGFNEIEYVFKASCARAVFQGCPRGEAVVNETYDVRDVKIGEGLIVRDVEKDRILVDGRVTQIRQLPS